MVGTCIAKRHLLNDGAPQSGIDMVVYRRPLFYDPTPGRFTTLDPFEGDVQSPQSLHKYTYCHADPVNFSDPTGQFEGLGGTLMSLAIGTSLRAIGVSAVIGGAMGGMGYLISTPMEDWNVLDSAKSILWGSAMGAFGATIIGGAWFAVQGVWQGIDVWRNPNATGLQKALASVEILVGIGSAWALKGQIRSQIDEWKNVYSKLPLKMEVQSDIASIRQHFANSTQPIKVGKTTIYFADNPRVYGSVIDENSFYITKHALDAADETLMKTLIEENLHLFRIRSGLAQTSQAAVGMGGQVAQEESIVKDLTEMIFEVGQKRTWW